MVMIDFDAVTGLFIIIVCCVWIADRSGHVGQEAVMGNAGGAAIMRLPHTRRECPDDTDSPLSLSLNLIY